jgi:hypothetical protein
LPPASTQVLSHMNVRRRWGTANGRPLLRPHINCLSAEEREMQAGGATHRNHWCAGVAVCSQRSLVAVKGGACGLVDAIRTYRCRARTCMCSSAVCYTCFAMFRRHGIGQRRRSCALRSRYMRACLGLVDSSRVRGLLYTLRSIRRCVVPWRARSERSSSCRI